MRTCLIQSASGDYHKLQQSVFGHHAAYCEQHEIQYLCNFGTIQYEQHAIWDRLPLIQFALLLGNELVVWMDTDSLIVDSAVDLREASTEFQHIGMCRHPAPWKDQPWHYNAGVALFRNTAKTMEFLSRVQAIGQIEHPWKIQATMLLVNDEMNVISRIDDRWNSTEWDCEGGLNVSPNPVVESFHGQGAKTASEKVQSLLSRAASLL